MNEYLKIFLIGLSLVIVSVLIVSISPTTNIYNLDSLEKNKGVNNEENINNNNIN